MTIKLALLDGLIFMVSPAISDDGPKPSDPQPEFFFTRLAYTDFRGRGPAGNESTGDLFKRFSDGPNGFGFFFGRAGGAWMTDAWAADYKYMWGIQRLTNVRLYMEPHPLPILSPELFQFPYIYGVEVGQMELSDEDAQRLREYLLRGGFWHCDDFWGLRQLAQFRRQMVK